jgi:hypothetical protein
MKRACIAGLLAALTALALAACGGDDKSTGTTTEPGATGSTTVPGGSGDMPAEIAQGELPKDYPSDLPLYPGSKPTTAMMVGGSGLIILSSQASVADVLAHFREQLPAQGWTVDEVSESPGRVAAHKGSRSATISISEAEGGTEIGVALEGS